MGDTVAIGFSSKNVTSPLAQLWNRVSEIEADARLEKHQKHALIYPILLELHGIYPENTEIVSLLGENYAARGDFISAINTTLEAVEKDPLLLGGHLNLGKLYFAAGLPDKAEDHFLTAMQISPTNAELCRLYGQFLVYQKKTEDAVRLFREGARHNPDLEESFLKFARRTQKVQHGGPIPNTVKEVQIRVRPIISVMKFLSSLFMFCRLRRKRSTMIFLILFGRPKFVNGETSHSAEWNVFLVYVLPVLLSLLASVIGYIVGIQYRICVPSYKKAPVFHVRNDCSSVITVMLSQSKKPEVKLDTDHWTITVDPNEDVIPAERVRFSSKLYIVASSRPTDHASSKNIIRHKRGRVCRKFRIMVGAMFLCTWEYSLQVVLSRFLVDP